MCIILWLILGIIISVIFISRSFIVAYLLVFITIFIFKLKRNRKQSFFIGLFIFLASVLFITFYIKTDSSLGRLLIYKVSWPMLIHNFLTGGIGNFSEHYMFYQADYFRNMPASEKERLLAGNTYYAFNDYYQFIIEKGYWGLLTILAVTLFIIKCSIRAFVFYKNSLLLHLALVQITVLSFAALFNHFFEGILFKIIFFICLAIIVYYAFQDKPVIRLSLITFLLFAFSVLNIKGLNKLYHYKVYKQLDDAKELLEVNYIQNALQTMRFCYPILKNDKFFLNQYAQTLLQVKEYEQALAIYKSLIFLYPGTDTFMNKALCEEALGLKEEAKNSLKTAIVMVPSKFTSKYQLFNIYRKEDNHEKALYWAQQIIWQRIKVPSSKVSFIQQEATHYLNQYK
jgi:tetratricopeptide (TPR) repeat protein